jgi:hypothetical protein
VKQVWPSRTGPQPIAERVQRSECKRPPGTAENELAQVQTRQPESHSIRNLGLVAPVNRPHPNRATRYTDKQEQAKDRRGTAGLHAPRVQLQSPPPDRPRDLMIKRDHRSFYRQAASLPVASPCPTEARYGRTEVPAPATRPPAVSSITTCASRWPWSPWPAPIISSSSSSEPPHPRTNQLSPLPVKLAISSVSVIFDRGGTKGRDVDGDGRSGHVHAQARPRGRRPPEHRRRRR